MGNTCSTATESCGFACTGYDGKGIWEKRMEITESIPCETCKDHAVQDESAYHDVVNAGLGEKIYNPDNLRRFVKQNLCVYNSCVERGECKPL